MSVVPWAPVVFLLGVFGCLGLPIVDEGLYIMQGIDSCLEGEGYCMLGTNCTQDMDFLPSPPSQHCRGLGNGFSPPVNFSCCRYNEHGKASSVPPTTTLSSVTITGIDQLLQEEAVIMEYQEPSNDIPEGVDPSSIIHIVGVVTDHTGVLGLITEPYRPTVPVVSAATTPTTPSSRIVSP